MPHVSRHTPIQRVSDKTANLFVECITAKGSPAERRTFLMDLLTRTERTMLSKRLAIVYMLTKGYSFDDIQETLRVSPSTIARIWKSIQSGKYAAIVKRIQKDKADADLLRWLLDLMPPMNQSKKQYVERMRRLSL